VAAVKAFAPDEIILLPLYPQYSTTTSESSLLEFNGEARRQGLSARTRTLCCYPTDTGFVTAMADLLAQGLAKAEPKGAPRILFSAHGLPQKVIDTGDPYQFQVERTAQAVMARLNRPELDWLVCYQSRVGPLKWIGPSTDAEIMRAGSDGMPVVIVPLAFVSEHSETLVELDIEYAHVAEQAGVPFYVRVPTVRDHPAFIAGLADMVRAALSREALSCGVNGGKRLCQPGFARCPMAA
jgi:ferrochelatase